MAKMRVPAEFQDSRLRAARSGARGRAARSSGSTKLPGGKSRATVLQSGPGAMILQAREVFSRRGGAQWRA
jgi:hypothetical protein